MMVRNHGRLDQWLLSLQYRFPRLHRAVGLLIASIFAFLLGAGLALVLWVAWATWGWR